MKPRLVRFSLIKELGFYIFSSYLAGIDIQKVFNYDLCDLCDISSIGLGPSKIDAKRRGGFSFRI